MTLQRSTAQTITLKQKVVNNCLEAAAVPQDLCVPPKWHRYLINGGVNSSTVHTPSSLRFEITPHEVEFGK